MVTKPIDKIVYTPQEIDNLSFDDEFGLRLFELLNFDGQGLQRGKAQHLALHIEYDASGNPLYLGQGAPGTPTSAAYWQIRKLTFDAGGNVTAITYANGSANYDQIWDNRTSLTYS